MSALGDLIANIVGPDAPSPFTVGTVTGTAPLTVNWRGSAVRPASYLATYTPLVGDVVLMARNGVELIVLGDLA